MTLTTPDDEMSLLYRRRWRRPVDVYSDGRAISRERLTAEEKMLARRTPRARQLVPATPLSCWFHFGTFEMLGTRGWVMLTRGELDIIFCR